MYFKYCDISSGRNRDSQGTVECKQGTVRHIQIVTRVRFYRTVPRVRSGSTQGDIETRLNSLVLGLGGLAVTVLLSFFDPTSTRLATLAVVVVGLLL